MLSTDEVVLIGIVALTLILILSNRIRVDLVALTVLLALGFAGMVTPSEAISGFSSPAVITLIGLFVITHALEVTGVIHSVARRVNKVGSGSEKRLTIIFMAAGALLSMVMNNIAAGAVLLPAAVRVARDTAIPASKLLIPLSFGTLVGGMATFLTTANIIMGSILEDQGLRGLGMMDFMPTGGLIAFAGLLYMLLIGRRLLPVRETISQTVTSSDLYETYELGQRLWEVQIPAGTWLANREIRHSGIGEKLGLTIVGIWRGHRAILSPNPDEIIEPYDYLLVMGQEERVVQLTEWGAVFQGRHYSPNGDEHNYAVELTEVIIPPRSEAVGKTLTEVDFRNKYGLTAVALWREGRSYRTDVGRFPLQVGDAILMVGAVSRIKSLAADRNYLVLGGDFEHSPIYPNKAIPTLIITAIVLIAAILDLFPLPMVVLAGTAAVILTGSIKMEEAYQSVEWQVIFLIAGMLPLSVALVNTGLADRIGLFMVENLAGFGPLLFISGLFILTVLVAQVVGGQVTALVVGPIAISAVLQVDTDSAQAMAVVVAIGCSTAFLTPIAHPVNILMMGPGGYTFGDFFKVGVGMTLVVFFTLIIGLILFWGIS
jgi:di/tricarboxylate transporter